MKIAFVCTGNTCRSPMAEYFFKDLVEKRGLAGNYEVTSFGLGGFGGYEASVNSKVAMEEIGLDLSQHRSRTANPETLDQELFLTMATSHRDVLRNHFPQKLIFTLKEFSNFEEETLDGILTSYHEEEEPIYPKSDMPSIDIADPYGGDLEEYRKVRDEIIEGITSSFERVEMIRKSFEN